MTSTRRGIGTHLKAILVTPFKVVLDHTLIRALRYVRYSVAPPPGAHDEVFTIVNQRAAATSADYVERHLDGALLFPTREQVWDFALSKAKVEGLFGEFGVFEGLSINHMAKALQHRHATIHGFDSFEGLKEDWSGTWYPAGAFDAGGRMPKVESNVTLIKGWFDETVPSFLRDHPDEPFSFIHIDSDTFEAATLLLGLLKDRIVRGTVIVFDEYLGFPNWQKGEFLAWRDFVETRCIDYCYLAFSNTPAAILVL